ncbi:acyl-CoA dehydrogenase family protein [Mycobacterium sp. E796]|uniref:acyl-CoA dehydrogenase family protein n=1 Tax=Mycobacterium sp. E796 TaxID=1834151 RepID=UPI000802467E|nr:acyl-CoA dehydrogenase family protein [Mycobacterium sp. E796]OBI52001.1 hypothetical protein A5706_02045 [Mycobacterium sp. E796]
MDFLPDPDQLALAAATRDFLEARFPIQHVRAHVDNGQWSEIAQLGWLGLAADEEVGGAGATLLDEAFVFREIGRGLAPGPILSTLAAARVASIAGNAGLAADLIAGKERAGRAVVADNDGEALVVDPCEARYALLLEERRAALYQMPESLSTHPGIEDGTVLARLATASFGPAVAHVDDPVELGRLRRTLLILTSAQLAGIALATSDFATEHAKSRIQFGKPIGAFQAIKHKCADMATSAFAADNLMFMAALNETSNSPESDYDALAAATFCRRAALANARSNIQIHGAMGFTAETSAHRYVKRAHLLCALEDLGHAARRLARLPYPDKE